MVTTFARARDEIDRRLRAVFESPVFTELYEGATQPKVYKGFPANEPPFYVAVDEIVDTAATSGAASMGHARVDFTIHVWCFSRHTSQETAADTLLAYVDAVIKAILADHTLKGAVDNCFPSIETAGTAADSSKRYLAAASVAVECSVFSQCPKEIMEVVKHDCCC